MNGHTPAPWHVDGAYVVGPNSVMIVRQAAPYDDAPNDLRLMAAAPDLLAELKNATAQMEWAAEAIEAGRYDEALLHVNSMVRGRKAAIAKATGAQP